MKRNKILAVIAAVTLSMSAFASCGNSGDSSSSDSRAESSSASDVENSLSAADESSETEDNSSETSEDSQAEKENDGETSDITPAMWTVTSPEGTKMTMLGSMHALGKEDYPLPDVITDALDSADILAVECDVSEANSLSYQTALMKEMVYDDGTTLKDNISEEAYSALDSYLQTYGLNAEALKTYKPWAVANTVDNMPLLYTKLSADLGIDAYLIEQAKEKGKEIYEVESVDFQMDLIMNFSQEYYDLRFRSLVGETKDSQVNELTKLYEIWKSGDIEAFEELCESEEDVDSIELTDEEYAIIEDYNDQMLYDRNIGMEEAIKELLAEDKNVFYVVGAAHYISEGGIIDLLEKDGYTVGRIEY